MTSVPSPPIPENTHRNGIAEIAQTVIFSIISLALGHFCVILPTQTGAGVNNQAEVSDMVSEKQPFQIDFSNNELLNGSSIQVTSPITNGNQSHVVRVGGISYSATIQTYSGTR